MTDHAHRFVCPSPNGPTSLGVCACGESRLFKNSTDDAVWKEKGWGMRRVVDPEEKRVRQGWVER